METKYNFIKCEENDHDFCIVAIDGGMVIYISRYAKCDQIK